MPLGPAPRNAPTPTVRYRGSWQLLNFHRRSHKTQESGAGQTHQTGDSASRLMGGRFAWLMGGPVCVDCILTSPSECVEATEH